MTDAGMETDKVAVVGAGAIGAAWAIVFARAGFSVGLYDVSEEQGERARALISERLAELDRFGLVGAPIHEVRKRIAIGTDLAAALADACLVLEAGPERIEVKQAIFADLDRLCTEDVILTSSSSALTASRIAASLEGRHRCLIAHPGNPPYLLPVVELVPAPFTDAAVFDRAAVLFSRAGMSVVRLAKEVDGFVFNRLQGAMLREAYCLVRDGVIGVDDLDAVVRDGLGMRYAFIGPFETSDLNVAGGIEAHAARMGKAYHTMGLERGQDDPWTEDLVRRVTEERRRRLPLEALGERVAWRDRRLMALARLKASVIHDDA